MKGNPPNDTLPFLVVIRSSGLNVTCFTLRSLV